MSSELEKVWEEVQPKLLFPSDSIHPYYIVAPRWSYTSAGIRALHLLCHALNRAGQKAYMIHYPLGDYPNQWTNPNLMTPKLDERTARLHLRQERMPIVLYPETIRGNPVKAPVVARWVLNFPGLLGGDPRYPETEICFGYSKELAQAAGSPDQVLHLPTINTQVFNGAGAAPVRKGGCFYATKYKHFHKGELLPVTNGCFEITSHQKDSLQPAQLAELLKRSEVFYAYENTALATEAVLCGCPAVFIPNEHLSGIIGQAELGSAGFAWGFDRASVERARATVDEGAINYLRTYALFWEQLEGFIRITQRSAESVAYKQLIEVPRWPPTGVWKPINRIGRAIRRLLRGSRRSPKP